jgi:GT2 family glycosyltransferase
LTNGLAVSAAALDRTSRQDGASTRPTVRGKFLFLGGRKLHVKGTTYGTFRPNEAGDDYPDPEVVERDFTQMAANGFSAVRTYTVPPRWLLDAAGSHGLHVMVGLPWEHHVAFLDERELPDSIVERVRAGVRQCTGHPAVLCYAVGNEIPASIVRWHGRRRIERYIRRLYEAAKEEDPNGLVTYVNYPSTEYLELPFLDLACFNVYLEAERALDAYLARLHNVVGDRPLLMAEIGLDSRRHGEDEQARVLRWQIRTAAASGCTGAFVFGWTDEWYRGGHDIEDWDFGLTDRQRRPKPALAAVREAFSEGPFSRERRWPRVSVVVCTYNGEPTLQECLEGLRELDYPDYEVIVVNDGSTDTTNAIVGGFGFRLICTENRGLASARNTGMEAATGEIVAYIDRDARPDPHWLTHLAAAFESSRHCGIGGPNIAPADDGPVADCVANAPGGPTHVLLSDREAEHIPGCNMAFRKWALQAVGGFDPRFRSAGDDVDMCWRLRDRRWTLGFSPAAMVWHRRRDSVRDYWRQQRGYGKAEGLLEGKWPEKYNSLGHLRWAGRVYDRGVTRTLLWPRQRVYHGPGGTGLFQSLYQPAAGTIGQLMKTPEWYLVIAALAGLSVLGGLWRPLLLALPLLLIATGGLLVQAGLSAAKAVFTTRPPTRFAAVKLRALTALLHLLQPAARLWGRLSCGLTPWRRRTGSGVSMPRVRRWTIWSERWRSQAEWLGDQEAALRSLGTTVLYGGDCHRWDLEVKAGMMGAARTLMAIEEHGAGKQLVRLRAWPRWSAKGVLMIALFGLLGTGAAADGAWAAAVVLGGIALVLAGRAVYECGAGLADLREAVARLQAAETAYLETADTAPATAAYSPEREAEPARPGAARWSDGPPRQAAEKRQPDSLSADLGRRR